MNKHALQSKNTKLDKPLTLGALRQTIASIFGRGSQAINKSFLTDVLLRIVEAIDNADRYLTNIERRGPGIYFTNSNSLGETYSFTHGSILRGTTNVYFHNLAGATPADDGWSPLTDDWSATAGATGYLAANAVLVDTSTGKMYQYQHTGSYLTYTATDWVLVYTPPVVAASPIITETGTIAAAGTESINVDSGQLVTHITLLKTDANPSPTVTVAIQGGETLLSSVPFDEAGSTVLNLSYMRGSATILDITPNCAVSYVVYMSS